MVNIIKPTGFDAFTLRSDATGELFWNYTGCKPDLLIAKFKDNRDPVAVSQTKAVPIRVVVVAPALDSRLMRKSKAGKQATLKHSPPST